MNVALPYPAFVDTEDYGSLACVGRCRLSPADSSAYADILQGCHRQSQVDDKKERKKYMKQSAALAKEYLKTIDVSVINVEVLLPNQDILSTDGCLASCFLDAGCARIVVSDDADMLSAIQTARLPRERLMVHYASLPETFDAVADDAHAASVGAAPEHLEMALRLFSAAKLDAVWVLADVSDPSIVTSLTTFSEKSASSAVALVNPTPELLGQSYANSIRTDRPDGLYTTVVCTRSGEALGLVYSSDASIIAALECGRGVYWSRSRGGLWRKGDSSGHYQTLHRLDVDCDGDALRFTITQNTSGDEPAAFCHIKTLSCWGPPRGVTHLQETLQERLHSAPEGSYTKRLFDDAELLRDKLVEEAQELSEAEGKQHVAEELADVIYFAMVRAAKAGVSLDDAVTELDKRARKVTRRAGDSKAERIAAGQAILDKARKSES